MPELLPYLHRMAGKPCLPEHSATPGQLVTHLPQSPATSGQLQHIRETVTSLCRIAPAEWLYRLQPLHRSALEGFGWSFQSEVAMANSGTAVAITRLGRKVVVAPSSGLLSEI